MGEPRGSSSGRATKVIGDYELVSKIGKGGMGSVFKAKRISTGEVVAFKVLPPSFAKNKNLVARFQREMRIILGLKHENVVQGLDSGQVGNLHYLAMEFVDGKPVTDHLVRRGRLGNRQTLKVMSETALALAYAHSKGLIHRDVKPDNILIGSDGTVKLCDLGLAREQADTAFTMIGTKLGTPKYMSPEQVEGVKTIDGRADIYSLGATAYHLLTGSAPHDEGSGTVIMAAQLEADITPVMKARPDAYPGLAAVIDRCLEKRPEDRYQSMENLVEDLELVAEGKEPKHAAAAPARSRTGARARARGGRPEARGKRAGARERTSSSSKGKLLVVLLVLAVLAAAAWALFLGPLKEHGDALKRAIGLDGATSSTPRKRPK